MLNSSSGLAAQLDAVAPNGEPKCVMREVVSGEWCNSHALKMHLSGYRNAAFPLYSGSYPEKVWHIYTSIWALFYYVEAF